MYMFCFSAVVTRIHYMCMALKHFVSTALQGVGELKSELLAVASKQSYMGENIPQAWLSFENAIIKYECMHKRG